MMEWGLLWFDDHPTRDLAEKIRQAARRYRQKFGAEPNVCYVHRSLTPPRVAGIRVVTLPTVLRHHFWLGQREE
jgi:hypothetical protein